MHENKYVIITKEEYDSLCSALLSQGLDKGLFVEYESIYSYLKEMLDLNKNKTVDDSISSQIKLTYLFALRWGMLSLAVGKKTNLCLYSFQALFAGISNTTLAIIKLAQDGLDYQASCLIRNLYELCFTMLAIIVDPIKREMFVKGSIEELSFETWKKYFTFKKLDNTIHNYEKRISMAFDNDEFLKNWRRKHYQNFSSYVHNDFLSLFCYGYSLPSDDEDIMNINLFGTYSTRIDIISANTNALLWYTDIVFSKLLTDKEIDLKKDFFVCEGEDKNLWNTSSFVGILSTQYYMFLRNQEEEVEQ